MQKRITDRLGIVGRGNGAAFNVCALLFMVGCVVGVAASGLVEVDATLRARFLSPAAMGFGDYLFSASKYHLVAVFFALSALGVLGLPAVTGVRGFFMCFTTTLIVRVFGASGIPLALATTLPATIITVPSLLILSARSLDAAKSLTMTAAGVPTRATSPYAGVFARTLLACAALAILSAGIETLWGAKLIGAFAAKLV
ncbi:MAG: stage II sporulation protein M [Oscillospiraceae bacterium]|jgi:hypothetical protein|nr:stage II sporulation protein M [Oscillospiraceae bacterium]